MKVTSAAVLLGFAVSAYAQTNQKCLNNNDICYSLNIPESTSQSGSGDIYLQITAKTSYSWVGIGQGGSMSGANMFIIYTDSTGNNVTVSPRLGTGHVEPQYTSDTQFEILSGTGVSNGFMTANIKCFSCSSWTGGNMNFSPSSSSSPGWIYAAKSGSPLGSSDQSANIEQHDGTGAGIFNFDFSAATGGSSANPFASSGTGSGSSTVSCRTRASTASATRTGQNPTRTGFGYGFWTNNPTAYPTGGGNGPFDDGGNGNNKRAAATSSLPYCDEISGGLNSGSSSSSSINSDAQIAEFQRQRRILIAHGVLGCLVFAILLPAGAIAIRLLSFPGLVWFHAGLQVFSYFVFIAAVGLGVYIATRPGSDYLHDYHPIIGIVLLVLLFFQPVLGWLHHALFKKYRSRTLWSYAHIWLGRIIITLGIINGGLGFLLADNTKTGPIVYGVVAGVVWLAYIVAIFIGEGRRRSQRDEAPPKYTESSSEQVSQTESLRQQDGGYYAPGK